MDYIVLGQSVLLGFIGLSIFTVSVGLTVRLFLGPVVRDVAERLASKPGAGDSQLLGRIDHLDDRLAALESGIDRIEAAQDFDRRLGTAGPRKTETA